MIHHDYLAARIREIGFSCTRCGACCRGTAEDTNLVMVTPGEIDRLSEGTGMTAESFTEPYPESIMTEDGGSFTFERCLSRSQDGCCFLSVNSCTAYLHRPWICRTYPFMLDGDDLLTFPCEGIGREISPGKAHQLAHLLVERKRAERKEEEAIGRVLEAVPLPPGKRVLIDSRGMEVI